MNILSDKRILFICIPEKGHLHPLLGLAKDLYLQGARLAFFGRESVDNVLDEMDIHAECYASRDPRPDWFSSNGQSFAEKQNDKEWMRDWLKFLLIDVVPNQVACLREVVASFRPDLLISDPMVYATHIVSQESRIPWVAVSSSINPLVPVTWNAALTEAFDQCALERARLFPDRPKFHLCDVVSPWLNFVYFSEDYVPRELCQNDCSFYVGTSWDDHTNRERHIAFPFDRMDPQKRHLFVSLGSQNFYHPEIFQTIIDAVAGWDDLQLILSVGSMDPQLLHHVPDDAILQSYVPQLALMEQTDLFITHGGSNSTMEALSYGLPVGVVPLCNDQFFQARMVESAQVGVVLDGIHPSEEAYREAIGTLLRTPIYRTNARALQASFRTRGGLSSMVDRIARLMRTGQPQRPATHFRKKTRRFYISPHLDDVVLSCGMKLHQEQDEENFIITVFTEGGPIHAQRREEDKRVAQLLNAHYIHLGYPDAPFRNKAYKDFPTLLFHHGTEEESLVETLSEHIRALCDQYAPDELYFPLGIGGHIDHHIVSMVGRKLMESEVVKLFFYDDAPYNEVRGWREYRLGRLGALTTYREALTTLRQQNIPFVDKLLDKAGNDSVSEELYRKEISSLIEGEGREPIFLPVTERIGVDYNIKNSLLSIYSTEYTTFMEKRLQQFNDEALARLVPIQRTGDNCWTISLDAGTQESTLQSVFETILPMRPLFVRTSLPKGSFPLLCRSRNEACVKLWGAEKTGWALPPMSDVLNGSEIRITVYGSEAQPLYIENVKQKKACMFDTDIQQDMCRGAILEQDNTSMLWSSATMSMVDEKVLFPDDAYEQLYKSMENLRWLLSQFNLKQYGLEYGFAVEDIQQLIVYYKEEEDLEVIRGMAGRFVSRNCDIDYQQSDMPYDGLRLMIEAQCYKKGYVKEGEKYKVENGRIRTESFELHVSEHCNLRCDQCCNLSPFHKERFMSMEELNRICDFLEKNINPDVIKVAGGEPLLHPQLLEILQTIKRRFPDTNLRIITNGLLANQRLTEDIMATIDQLWVSNYQCMPVPEKTIVKIKELAKKYHVLLNIKAVDQFYVIVRTDEEKDTDRIKEIYENCWMKYRCLMVRNNIFFKCTRAAYIEEQQRIFQIGLEHPIVAADEGIRIDDPEFQQKALQYLNDKDYISSCKLCLGVSGSLFPSRQLPKTK